MFIQHLFYCAQQTALPRKQKHLNHSASITYLGLQHLLFLCAGSSCRRQPPSSRCSCLCCCVCDQIPAGRARHLARYRSIEHAAPDHRCKRSRRQPAAAQ
jgi:hypothetical protein